jgi:hypothetical protein
MYFDYGAARDGCVSIYRRGAGCVGIAGHGFVALQVPPHCLSAGFHFGGDFRDLFTGPVCLDRLAGLVQIYVGRLPLNSIEDAESAFNQSRHVSVRVLRNFLHYLYASR